MALVTGVPCTLLRMDLTGDYIAVGASDGQISVFHTEALSRVSVRVDMCCGTLSLSFCRCNMLIVCASHLCEPLSKPNGFALPYSTVRAQLYNTFLFNTLSMFILCLLSQVGSYACHDLPVTGMGFAPPALAQTLGTV